MVKPKKKPLLASLLSLLVVGMGQVYNKEYKKGIVLFSFSIFFMILGFSVNSLFNLFSLVILIYVVYDAYKTAKKTINQEPYKNAVWITVVIFMGLFFYGFWYGFYNVYYGKLGKIQIVEGIVQEYHRTHTYSGEDFFVCSDMAIDVWNIVKSKGINAQIVVGNLNNPDVNFTEYNHAWVLAEVEPLTWLALETTGGYVVYKDNNPLYYKGIFFDNPREFKSYVDLKNQYNLEVERINKLNSEWNNCSSEYEKLRIDYNKNYAGKPLSNEAINERARVSEKLGTCNKLTDELNEEVQVLSSIVNEIKGLLT
jgi:hypothetical protein